MEQYKLVLQREQRERVTPSEVCFSQVEQNVRGRGHLDGFEVDECAR